MLPSLRHAATDRPAVAKCGIMMRLVDSNGDNTVSFRSSSA
jgi:hypothetical protein